MSDFLRSYATPVSFLTFIGAGLTGVMMFFGVRGGPIGDLHEWFGIVFVVALALHLARNRRGMLAMLRTTSGKLIAGGFGVAMVAFILFALPLVGGVAPDRGHGPWRVVNAVANAPIEKMAPAVGLTPEEAVLRLKAGGVPVDGTHETLNGIAHDHSVPVPRMLNLLLASKRGGAEDD